MHSIQANSVIRNFISSKYLFDIMLILLLVYFGYNTVVGNRGLLNYLTLSATLPESINELNRWKAEREVLDIKIKLLDIHNIDIDFLDELARKDLGMISKNEKCFILPN